MFRPDNRVLVQVLIIENFQKADLKISLCLSTRRKSRIDPSAGSNPRVHSLAKFIEQEVTFFKSQEKSQFKTEKPSLTHKS